MAAQVTYGSDPEFFLFDARVGTPIPAVGLVGGTKDKPRMVSGYGLQEDNVMAEFTTIPSESIGQNLDNALEGVYVLTNSLVAGAPACSIYEGCAWEFPREVLISAGPQALQFGCSPDFDAYNLGERHPRVNPAALDTAVGAWRFAGGHIHVGYKDVCAMPEYVAALMCDLTLGLSLIGSGEAQGARRRLYGMAGRFRPTRYGVEYRTPSNAWLYRADLRGALMRGAEALSGIMTASQDVQVRLFNEVPWNDVQRAINAEVWNDARDLQAWLANTYKGLGFEAMI